MGISVEILGQNLVVASDRGDEWARFLARAVEERIKEIKQASRTVNSINLVILAALNFADELERLRHEHEELLERINALNQRLSAVTGGVEQV